MKKSILDWVNISLLAFSLLLAAIPAVAGLLAALHVLWGFIVEYF